MNVALCGGGTVGGGVCELLAKHEERLAAKGVKLNVKKMLVRDASKQRDFQIPEGCQVTTDQSEVLADPDIDMVVEMMGGVDDAKRLVFGALSGGKHVVTANKALVAAYMTKLLSTLDGKDTRLGLEAAVCGGIPIIHTLQRDYGLDQVQQLAGIMNGTTNFILSKMESEGASYGDVLAEAQALGFAEADPTADVEGHDARAKLLILTKLAFGVHVPEELIPCTGISAISADDFAYAQQLGSTVKLLGVCKLLPGTTTAKPTVNIFVSPCVVPHTNAIAQQSGPGNIVEVVSENMGTAFYIGPGAGRFPTANSIVGDMVSIAEGGCGPAFELHRDYVIDPDIEAEFFVRFQICDKPGIIAVLGELAEKYNISIHAILQNPVDDHTNMAFAMTTETAKSSAVQAMCREFAQYDFNLVNPVVMPILK